MFYSKKSNHFQNEIEINKKVQNSNPNLKWEPEDIAVHKSKINNELVKKKMLKEKEI